MEQEEIEMIKKENEKNQDLLIQVKNIMKLIWHIIKYQKIFKL